jgi:hypothetical protein
MIRFAKYTVLATWLGLTPVCWADVTSVGTMPASENVPLGRSASVALAWNVTRDNTSANVGQTVTSTGGTFRASSTTGPVLQDVSIPLSQARPIAGATTSFKIKETVLVPTSIIFRAQKLGATKIVYSRSFVDCAACISASGTISLPISSPSAAGFSISRVQLQFEDGAPTKLVPRESPLRVFAVISFTGTGLLEATWELAGPTSTAGEPILRTMQTVRRYLVTGTSPATLRSPTVPTSDAGLYLVTLRIAVPELAFEQPIVRYFVGETQATAKPTDD